VQVIVTPVYVSVPETTVTVVGTTPATMPPSVGGLMVTVPRTGTTTAPRG
jgi:hypothetical protein